MAETGSFIENVNNIAKKIDVIESANNIFDEGVIPVLEEIALLDLDLAIQDLKKGTFLGNRKIDIDLSLNKQGISENMAILDALTVWNDTATTVYYSSATVTFVDGHIIEVPFTNDDLSPLNISSHGSLVTQLLKDAPFTTYLTNTGIFDDVGGATGALFRLYDIVGASSNVEKIQLHAVSGNYIVQAPIYYWGKTTSAFQTLSMRASDIIKLGNDIDSIIALANKITEILSLQSHIPQFVTNPDSLYTNIAKLQVIYDEIVAITTVYDDIKVGGTNYINTASADLQLGGTSKLAVVAADLQLGAGSVIVTVKSSIANVNITALAIANINTTAASIANVNAVGGSIANVNAVGGSIANINAVAANKINIDAVNANKINIDTAAANITAIQNASANAATAAEQAAIATSKAGISEAAANVAVAKANEIKAITVATVTTGIAGSSAAVSYNPADGKFYFTIPQGNKGDKGDSFSVNSIGLLASRALYDAQIGGFSFLALDEAKIYFKLSSTSGDWSLGSPFGKGEKGDIGLTGYGWLHGAGVPDNAVGRDNDFYLDMASGNVYLKVLGVWVYEMSILSILDDATVSAIKTWSSSKISTELGLKANQATTYTKTEVDTISSAKVSISDIQDILTSTDTTKPLSAKQGKVLKDLIDNLVTLLGSNDVNLDTLQEIVSFIKLNKTTLDSLAVANIAGLVTALAAKADLATTYTKTEVNNLLSSVDASPITTPTITAPTTGATDFIGTVTKSAFATSTSYAGALDYANWQLSYTSDFTIIQQESTVGNLTTWTPSVGLPLQLCYIRVKDGSDGHRSGWSPTVNFTTPNIFINTPTMTVTGTPTDVPETPTLTTSAFSVNGGSDTHASTDWEVRKNSDNSLVWSSYTSTTNKLTINVPSGLLLVSTAYKFRARHNGTTYGSSGWVEVAGTTKTAFIIPIGVAGALDFGVAPSSENFAALGLAEMTGTNTSGHDNWGNYQHSDTSIVVHVPKFYYRVGNASAPQYATYGLNSLEIKGTETFVSEAAANLAGYAMHRAFIDGGAEKGGFFFDKYLASKLSTNTLKAVSVKNGNPIGLTTNTTYTPSSTMTGCTGILADAVTLSRARGAGWNNVSVFMVGAIAMLSLAHAQMSSTVTNCAWYNATYNFPKGCNNGSRQDVNDTSVSWTASPDTAAKGLTGSASTFAKSTHNGQNSGIADVNGLMYQVALGMTNYGTTATDAVQIATNTLYVLKKTAFLKDLTAGWAAATDAWGNTTNLATRYDAVTSPITISAAVDHKWGSGANQVLSPDTTGVAHDLCGFLPKNDAAADITGTNQFGMDRMYKYNGANMYPGAAGSWSGSASAGVFYRDVNSNRSNDGISDGFRAAAYAA